MKPWLHEVFPNEPPWKKVLYLTLIALAAIGPGGMMILWMIAQWYLR